MAIMYLRGILSVAKQAIVFCEGLMIFQYAFFF